MTRSSGRSDNSRDRRADSAPPSTIRIGGVEYVVSVVPPDLWPHDNLWGQITYADQAIRINGETGPDVRRDSVLHETVHGIMHERMPEEAMRGFAGDNADKLEEMIVGVISTGLLQVIRDNPELISWLQET